MREAERLAGSRRFCAALFCLFPVTSRTRYSALRSSGLLIEDAAESGGRARRFHVHLLSILASASLTYPHTDRIALGADKIRMRLASLPMRPAARMPGFLATARALLHLGTAVLLGPRQTRSLVTDITFAKLRSLPAP
jgi:hypothetical protein